MGIFKNNVIGLVIDSKEIRAVELKGSRKKPDVAAWGKVKLPEGVVKEGKLLILSFLVQVLTDYLPRMALKAVMFILVLIIRTL